MFISFLSIFTLSALWTYVKPGPAKNQNTTTDLNEKNIFPLPDGYLFSMKASNAWKLAEIRKWSSPAAFAYNFTTIGNRDYLKELWANYEWLTWKLLQKESNAIINYRVALLSKVCVGIRNIAKALQIESESAHRIIMKDKIQNSHPNSKLIARFDCKLIFEKNANIIRTKLVALPQIIQEKLVFGLILKNKEKKEYALLDEILVPEGLAVLKESEIKVNAKSVGYLHSMRAFHIERRLKIDYWKLPRAANYEFVNTEYKETLQQLWKVSDWLRWNDLFNDEYKLSHVGSFANACINLRKLGSAPQLESISEIRNRMMNDLLELGTEFSYLAILECWLEYENKNVIETKIAGYLEKVNDRPTVTCFMVLLEGAELESFVPLDTIGCAQSTESKKPNASRSESEKKSNSKDSPNNKDNKNRQSDSSETRRESSQSNQQNKNENFEVTQDEENKSYYDLLGVEMGATNTEIKKAYHKLAKIYHPDKNQNKTEIANEKMKEINNAFEILGDPTKRRDYNSRLILERYSNSQKWKSNSFNSGSSAVPKDQSRKDFNNQNWRSKSFNPGGSGGPKEENKRDFSRQKSDSYYYYQKTKKQDDGEASESSSRNWNSNNRQNSKKHQDTKYPQYDDFFKYKYR